MKLRIQGNSLRLRLTRKEVAQLHGRGRVESLIEFAPGRTLSYALEGSSGANAVGASFDGQAITVIVPKDQVAVWAEGEQVSIEGFDQAGVHLLIEKDFQCMHKPGHQDPDAYPNPLAQ
ncbi:MAG: hypothetical protein DMG22_01520 [Acidobacteria bacterium]|nr:MAG: hypothetical protein DMG22_01520 [Acidobacteriota bacterium]